MQAEKSQLKGKRIMPETRLTEFPALSVVILVLLQRFRGVCTTIC